MEVFLIFFYKFLLFACFTFSLIASYVYYSNNKHKLLNISERISNGWNLRKAKLRIADGEELIKIPTNNKEAIYYKAILEYEESFKTQPDKKGRYDIKYFRKSKEREFHKDIVITISKNIEIQTNTSKIKFDLNQNLTDKPLIPMADNQKPLYLNEFYAENNKIYYILFEIVDKKIVPGSISISDKIDNFKNEFLFFTLLLWIPTILYAITYKFIIGL